MPYKYIVSQLSEAFASAPPMIMNALSRLTWAGQHSVVGDSWKPFNEMLVLGYLESGKIGVGFR